MGFAFLAITMDDPGAFDLKQGVARVQYVGEIHASGF
jgi:hypothetical protein